MSIITIVSIQHIRKTYVYEDLDGDDNLLEYKEDIENGEIQPDNVERISEDVVSITVE